MKTFAVIIFAIIVFWSSPLTSREGTRGPRTSNNKEISKEDIKSEVSGLMRKFASSGFTLDEEMKTMEVMQRIAEKYGTKVVPFLLEGMKNENEKIRYYSLLTITIITLQFKEKQGFSKIIDMTTFSFTPDEKKMIEEIFSSSLKATEDMLPEMRRSAFYMLDILRTERAIPVFKRGIEDNDMGVRFFACRALKHMGFQEYNELEIITGKKFQNPEDYVQFLGLDIDKYGMSFFAERELIKLGKKSITVLLKLASSNKEPERGRAIHILTQMKAEEVIPIFETSLKEETKDETMRIVQVASLYALRRIYTPKAIETALKYGFTGKDARIQLKTAELFFDEGQEIVLPVLLNLGQSEDSGIKIKVASILEDHKQKQAISIYIELLSDRHNFRFAKGRLETITGQKFSDIPPVTTKQMKEDYINKWKDWWDKNKDAFEFPGK